MLTTRCLKLHTAVSFSYRGKRSFSTSSKDSDIFEKSIIPTYHFQKSLPRLPIPELNQTCDRYLEFVAPLLTESERTLTTKRVESFRKGEGPSLQAALKAKDAANPQTSYISDMWYSMYLEGRESLPIHSNPFMAIKEFEAPRNSQLERAATLVRSSLRMWQSLKRETLVPEMFPVGPPLSPGWQRVAAALPSSVSYYAAYLKNVYPLDMAQYPRLFGTTRIPKKGRDELVTHPSPSHVTVLKGGRVFCLPVFQENGHLRTTQQLAADLAGILQHPEGPTEFPVGVLTSLPRDRWAALRSELLADPTGVNAKTLEMVESGLFVLSLDSAEPTSPQEAGEQFLHGGENGGNRWWDKSFSLILGKGGSAAVNFEHSWGDGVAVLRYLKDIYRDSHTAPPLSAVTPTPMTPLPWELSSDMKRAIAEARDYFRRQVQRLDLRTERWDEWGRKYLKEVGVGADGLMQVAFQTAHRRMHGNSGNYLPPSVYESASTAGFLHGRTETIRPLSQASQEAAQALGSSQVPRETQAALLRKAIAVHSRRSKEALMGQGVDRHLFALRHMASPGKVPDLFQDPSYLRLNHNVLSTSTLSAPAIVGGGFGPVVEDGLGIGYSSGDDFLGFNITSFSQSADPFLTHLRTVLRDCHLALEAEKAHKGGAPKGN